jgi:DNA-binding response OmpR family regulator
MTAIKVLLVDDEHEFTSILSKILRRRGFEVEVAVDGVSALAALSRQWFDVVLLDIKMPGPDGIQILGEIKSRTPSPEVILLTGHVSVAEESDGLKTGAFAYLLKPHPIPALINAIAAAAARSRETRKEEGGTCPRQITP